MSKALSAAVSIGLRPYGCSGSSHRGSSAGRSTPPPVRRAPPSKEIKSPGVSALRMTIGEVRSGRMTQPVWASSRCIQCTLMRPICNYCRLGWRSLVDGTVTPGPGGRCCTCPQGDDGWASFEAGAPAPGLDLVAAAVSVLTCAATCNLANFISGPLREYMRDICRTILTS